MKKCYIWGTGNLSGKIIEYIGIENVYAFVESRPLKKSYCGKKIESPKEIKIGDKDILIIASIYTIDICNIINKYNINRERTVFCVLDGVDQPIIYASNCGILRTYMKNEKFEEFINDCGIETMLYNAEFIRRVCDKYELTYPSEYDKGNGVLYPYSSNKINDLCFVPNIHTVWTGKWFGKYNM